MTLTRKMSPAAAEKIGAAQDAIVRVLYTVLPIGQERLTNAHEIVGKTDNATYTRVRDAVNLMKELGIIEVRLDWSGGGGKKAYWKLLVSQDEALSRMRDYRATSGTARPTRVVSKYEAQRAKRSSRLPVRADAPATASPEPTRLVAEAGELPAMDEPWRAVLREARKDDGAALIEATRQYAGRREVLRTKLAELAEVGIVIPEDAASFPVDDRLEALSLIMPFIEKQERWIDNLQRTVESQRSRIRDLNEKVGPLEREVERLRRANTRTVAATVGEGALVAHGD